MPCDLGIHVSEEETRLNIGGRLDDLLSCSKAHETMNKASPCFSENIRLLGGITTLARTDAEKYNLYAGLENLALHVENISHVLNRLEYDIRHIKAKLDQM